MCGHFGRWGVRDREGPHRHLPWGTPPIYCTQLSGTLTCAERKHTVGV